MKLYEVDKLNHIIKLLFDDKDVNLGAKLKFRLLTIMKQLAPHIESLVTIRNEKIQEYGTVDDNGQYILDPKDTEKFVKFQEDIDALINEDVDINIQKIKASDLFECNVPADYLVGLYDIIEEDV